MSDKPTRSQLSRLAEPFPENLIQQKPDKSRARYVSHSVVTERALEVVGPYSITSIDLIRGDAPAVSKYPAVKGVVTGAIVTIETEIDGKRVTLTEVGNCDNAAMQSDDGARAKNAVSDAIKRCWMRVGVGLHLWSGEQYTLDGTLSGPHEDATATVPARSAAPAQSHAQASNGRSDTPSGPQLKALGILSRELQEGMGKADLNMAREFFSWLAGRSKPVASSKDLTRKEVSQILDALGGSGQGGYRADPGRMADAITRWHDHLDLNGATPPESLTTPEADLEEVIA